MKFSKVLANYNSDIMLFLILSPQNRSKTHYFAYTVSSENFGVTIVIRQYLQCVIIICWDIYGEHIKYFCKNAVLATSVHELLKDREGPVKSRIAVQA